MSLALQVGSSLHRVCAVIALFTVVLPAYGLAQSDDDTVARATELYRRGRLEFDATRYADALELFKQSYELMASPNSKIGVARCLSRLGRPLEARMAYLEAERSAQASPTHAATAADAHRERLEVEAQLAQIQLDVADGIPELSVRIDDERISPSEPGAALFVQPGRHRVVASAPGHADLVRDLVINPGESVPLPIRLQPVRSVVEEGSEPPQRIFVNETQSIPAPRVRDRSRLRWGKLADSALTGWNRSRNRPGHRLERAPREARQ